jgi:hypothetical protein
VDLGLAAARLATGCVQSYAEPSRLYSLSESLDPCSTHRPPGIEKCLSVVAGTLPRRCPMCLLWRLTRFSTSSTRALRPPPSASRWVSAGSFAKTSQKFWLSPCITLCADKPEHNLVECHVVTVSGGLPSMHPLGGFGVGQRQELRSSYTYPCYLMDRLHVLCTLV